MRRRLLTIITVVIILVFSLSACGGNTETNELSAAGENGTVQENQREDVELVNSGYSIKDQDYISYGFIIYNTSEDTAYEDPRVIVTAYDGNGNVLATGDQIMNKIQPGEKQAFSSILDFSGEKPERVDFDVESGEPIKPSDKAITSSDFVIEEISERVTEYGETIIAGTVKNNSSFDTKTIGVTVLFFKDGVIVDGVTTLVDYFSAGQEKEFHLATFYVPEYDSYEVSAVNWDYSDLD